MAPPEKLSPADSASESALLVERARAGDRDAFGALYDRFAPLLLGVAMRILGGEREAHDLVHDVFLEAWLHVREYDPNRGSVRTWLLLRLRSRAADRLGRAEARYTAPLEADAQLEQYSSAPLAGNTLDELAVRRGLEGLESAVRAVLEYTYFAGLTSKEIAERTGIPIGTVKSRLARGLAALELALGERGGSDG